MRQGYLDLLICFECPGFQISEVIATDRKLIDQSNTRSRINQGAGGKTEPHGNIDPLMFIGFPESFIDDQADGRKSRIGNEPSIAKITGMDCFLLPQRMALRNRANKTPMTNDL